MVLTLTAALVLVLCGAIVSFGRARQSSAAQSIPESKFGHTHREDAAAHARYLQGMELFRQRTPESLLAAKQIFLDSTARDAADAEAWSGFAQVSTILRSYGIEHGPDGQSRAWGAAQRALTLNPALAEPHAVLGFADFFWGGSREAAEQEFRTAISLDPASSTAHDWYGLTLTYEARYDEALEQLNEAQRLEPSSTAVLVSRAFALGLSGKRDAATEMLLRSQGEHPLPSARYALAMLALVAPRNPAVYVQQRLELSKLAHDDAEVEVLSEAQAALARGGESAMWRSIVASSSHQRRPGVDAQLLAEAYTALGEVQSASEVIAGARLRSLTLDAMAVDPVLSPLWKEGRFAQ